jgi:hypothetical protein
MLAPGGVRQIQGTAALETEAFTKHPEDIRLRMTKLDPL